jgi:hypothetical protein
MNTAAQFLKPEVITLLLSVVALAVLFWYGKLPSVASFVAFCNAINTRGGNIVLLTMMVFLFVTTAMKYVYFIVGLEVAGKFTKESALAMSGYSFITGGVTGLAIGAWLKALSPQDMPTPGTTTASTTSTVNPQEPPKEEPKP